LSLSALDVAKFVEGVLYGIVQEQYGNLDTCITDIDNFATDILIAVNDFEQQSFSGVKAGLAELGTIVKLVPTAVKDCEHVVANLEQLEKMVEVFTHPLSLIWHAAKSLVVNGVDIY